MATAWFADVLQRGGIVVAIDVFEDDVMAMAQTCCVLVPLVCTPMDAFSVSSSLMSRT